MKQPINVFWFRRDLRLNDNAGLYHALKAGKPVLPIFIFDTNILDKLADKQDARVTFIHGALMALNTELEALGSSLLIKYGVPEKIWAEILETYTIDSVFTNRDYEKYGLERDELIENLVSQNGGAFHLSLIHI